MDNELTALRVWAILPSVLPLVELVNELEVQDFMARTGELSLAVTDEVLKELAEMMPMLEVAQGAVIALCCGALVEQGGNPELAFPGVLQHFQRMQMLLDTEVILPEGAFRFTVMSLMTMLCRSATNRLQLQQLPGLQEWLEEHDESSSHFYYLDGMLQVSDEESLYVLFPEYGTGLEVSASQVNNGFHLLTLLQPLVLRQATLLGLQGIYEPIDAELIRYASGDAAGATLHTGQDTALFSWLNALAYRGGPLDVSQRVWGEMPVREMPRVDNRIVLLATEKEVLNRSWDKSFFAIIHSAHRPQVQLRRMLEASEVTAMLHAIHPPVASEPSVAPRHRSWWQRLLRAK